MRLLRRKLALPYEVEIGCQVDINGQSSTVDAVVKQDYSGQTAEISVSFEWDGLAVGFPNVQISDSGSAPSTRSTVPLTVTSNNRNHSINNGIASPSTISGVVRSLDVYHASAPSHSDAVDIYIYLANFPKFARRCTLQPNINGIHIDFQYASDGKINRGAVVTGVVYGRLQEVIDLINDCCWLCSLAAGCFVTIPRIEVLINGNVVLTKLQSSDISMPDIGKPLVHDRMSADILKRFLEHSFAEFRAKKIDYSLCLLIHLGLLAKHHPYLEAKALLMSDFLEVLRDRFASSICVPKGVMKRKGAIFLWKIPQKRHMGIGFLRRLRILLSGNTKRLNRATFCEIMLEFCREHRFSGWSNDFVKFRNEIMHTGTIKGTNKTDRYRQLHHFCDRVLLALLNWDSGSGQYIPLDHRVNHSNTHFGVNRVPFRR